MDHNKVWKSLHEMEIPDYLTCLWRNLCAGQEATVRTGHGTTDWFQIGKGVRQGCMLSPCLFNLYAEYIMQNARKESKEFFGFTKSWTWLSNWTDWENCCCHSVAESHLTPCDRMDCSTPGFPVLHYFLEFAQTYVIESMMPSNHLILCHPLLLLSSIFPSIRVFSNKSVLCIRWPKYWSFSFRISPSSEYSGLISFRIDCFDFLAVQGTLNSLLQHHGTEASFLWCSIFFMVQLSYLYMTTGKTISLTTKKTL